MLGEKKITKGINIMEVIYLASQVFINALPIYTKSLKSKIDKFKLLKFSEKDYKI